MARGRLVVTVTAPTGAWSVVRKAFTDQTKAIRTEMEKPKKINPETFHPNTASEGSHRENIGEEPSTTRVKA